MLDDFIHEYTGRMVSFDGVPEHKGESMQLIAAWCKHLGLPFRWPAPNDWFADRDDDNFFEYWTMRTNKEAGLPRPGDVVIFEDDMPGGDGRGHASIYLTGTHEAWHGFDADWDGDLVHMQDHNWLYVRGWFTPAERVIIPEQPKAQKTNWASFAPPVRIGDSHDTILINEHIPRYPSMSAALAHLDSLETVPIHQYYVYRRLNGMMHLTRELGQPSGIWINPVDLEPKPEPIIEAETPQLEVVPEATEVIAEIAGIEYRPHPSLQPDDWDLSPIPPAPDITSTRAIKTHYGKLFLKLIKNSQVLKTIREKTKEL